ncbi:MAG: hypothetical protein AB1508_00485 [Pseudomonadota bacterium]
MKYANMLTEGDGTLEEQPQLIASQAAFEPQPALLDLRQRGQFLHVFVVLF